MQCARRLAPQPPTPASHNTKSYTPPSPLAPWNQHSPSEPADGRLVIADPTTPAMVIGATGSAKTTAVVILSILEWHGSVISTSVTADVLEATGGWRSHQGDIAVFDPADSLPDSLSQLARPWTPPDVG